jgi:hypothetical protein
MSSHLGSLSLTQPGDLLIALAEIGLAVFLAPWVTWWAWKRFLHLDWLAASFAVAAIGGFLLPIAVVYLERDRDITRLTAAALFIWLALGFPLVWFAARSGSRWLRLGLGVAYAVTVFGGLALAVVQSNAILWPQYSYFVERPDVLMSRNYWNALDDGAQVFDPVPYRAVTLFGRAGGEAFTDLYEPLPTWANLAAEPDPARVARAGYNYVYLDNIWWQTMTRDQRKAFREPCSILIAEERGTEGQFRHLLDVRACSGDSSFGD